MKRSANTLPDTGKKFFPMLVSKKWLEENPDAHAQIRKANPPGFARDVGTDSDEESEESERDGQPRPRERDGESRPRERDGESRPRERDGESRPRERDGTECPRERGSESSREEPVAEEGPEDGEGTSSA